ncbi:preprotein translocase subunit SecD [Halococcoides cellulosivorans]|uniref:Protein-export membrane protein SecD n=1 Tax=Halococcoides cellulosivorans TaxID=1679096 RepID=A0A2R4WYL1_9EURY|nr:preprotein translocase subunit SecD [Halococcoides cellulosivorans]AWB26606.1 preprotein translocase subunit SecD [Halococcoides cellulosivorans]
MNRTIPELVREEWRIILLVAALLVGTLVLFGPGAGSAGGSGNVTAASGDPTNLKYGLDLDGGTRIRAPLVGYTVSGINVTDRNETEAIATSIADRTGLDPLDVNVRLRPGHPEGDAVELYVEEVDREAVRAALSEEGYDVPDDAISEGVTEQTYDQAVQVLETKISQGGVSGGRVTTVTNPATGDRFVMVEVPGAGLSETLDLIESRGRVTLVAHYPTFDGGEYAGHENRTVLRRGTSVNDIRRVGPPSQQENGAWGVPITVADGAADAFADAMRETGFTEQRSCSFDEGSESPGSRCLLTVSDGEVVYAAGMNGDLAVQFADRTWTDDPRFIIMTGDNRTTAQQLSVNLRAGALPTDLDVQGGQTFTIEPSLGARFKAFGLLTGLVALLAVAGVVFLRYNRTRVAGPMVATAAAEVYLLLAFAAGIGLSLDLSHIAGLIAVVGTGADDLIIIADEILQREGEIATGRVFKNRLWKAFWVIGAAAATTIVAMSPLAILELGDLRGFAIVTIAGVLIGVIVTRPAYGDILRHLVLDRETE